MTQRKRRSQGWALAVVVALGGPSEAGAQVAKPQAGAAARPIVRVAARSPQGTAKSLAALARFANGQLGDSAQDKRIAAALARLPNARAVAQRIVAPYEGMSAAERGQVFVGVPELDKLTTRVFDRATLDKLRGPAVDAAGKANKTTLPPDPVDPKGKAEYELVYRGMKVSTGADADGTDEPVVFTAVFWPGNHSEPFHSATRTVPESGTLGVANGASSGASAGEVWTSPVWPGGWNSGIVFLSAVLEDNGDLAQRKEDINLLIALAQSEATEDSNPDRMLVLKRELEDALDLLHLAGRQHWDSRAVQVRLLTSAEYDQLYRQPAQASPFPHKLTMSHNPRGGDYTLYFDVPSPPVATRRVRVTVKQLEALGGERDGAENQQADFGLDVAIGGNSPASTVRTFAANKNLQKTSWTIERQVQAGANVTISLRLWDRDPPAQYACTSTLAWPQSVCSTYCAPTPVSCTPSMFNGDHCPSYGGVCPDTEVEYDINPLPDVGDGTWFSQPQREIHAVYDLGRNTLSGDLRGPAGTYTLTGTPGVGNQARIVVEVSQN